jgi:repressor LexA
MLIDEYLVDSPSDTFLLTIRGQSMQDAGLLPGDVVVVNRRASAAVGDIVVAMVAGAATVKQLARKEGYGLYLRARNPDFPDIHPVLDTEVVGVVVGQFRRYGRATNLNI